MYSAKGRTFLAFRYAGMKRPDDHLKLRDAGGHTWPGRLIDDGDRKTIPPRPVLLEALRITVCSNAGLTVLPSFSAVSGAGAACATAVGINPMCSRSGCSARARAAAQTQSINARTAPLN
jgi:hypothetical protein